MDRPPVWTYKPLSERRRSSRPPSAPRQAVPLCRSASVAPERGQNWSEAEGGPSSLQERDLWESSRQLGARIAAFLRRTETSALDLTTSRSTSDRSLSLASQAEEDESDASTLSGNETGSKETSSSRASALLRETERLRRELRDSEVRHSDRLALTRKTYDRKLADAAEEVEEQRGLVSQLRRGQARLSSQLEEAKLAAEAASAAAATAQRRLAKAEDAVSRLGSELRVEKEERERLLQERDQFANNLAALERALSDAEAEAERKDYAVSRLTEELREARETATTDAAAAAAQLRARHEAARKHLMADVEEARTQLQELEQAKLRLEREAERLRQDTRKQIAVHAEEVEQIRVATQKKIRGLESELEEERSARTMAARERSALIRKLANVEEEASGRESAAAEREKRLRRRTRRLRARLAAAPTESSVTSSVTDQRPLRRLAAQAESTEAERRALAKALRTTEADLSDARAIAEAAASAAAECGRRATAALRERDALVNRVECLEQLLTEAERENHNIADRATTREAEKALAEERAERVSLELGAQAEELKSLRSKADLLSRLLEATAADAEDHRRAAQEAASAAATDRVLICRLEGEREESRRERERAALERNAAAEREAIAQDTIRNLRKETQALRDDRRSLTDQLADAVARQREAERLSIVAEAETSALRVQVRAAMERSAALQAALTACSANSDSDNSFTENLTSEECWNGDADSSDEFLGSSACSRGSTPLVA